MQNFVKNLSSREGVKNFSSREGFMGVPYPMRRMMIVNAFKLGNISHSNCMYL